MTGNWNPEYEEIAGVLVSLGATHSHVEGFRHNPQESEEFEPLVREFWGSLAAG